MAAKGLVVDPVNNLDKIVLRTNQGDSCEIYLHGAHVTSWKTAAGEELLFVSKQALFQPPKAIRGGIPVCFPQFGPLGPMAQHGFARNTKFEVEEVTDWKASLVLKYDGKDHAAYPHPFDLRVTVSVCEANLVQEVSVTNTGDAPMQFTGALHTYFKVSAIGSVEVEGLQGVRYQDSLKGRQEEVEGQQAVKFDAEFDRIYCGAPDVIKIHDSGLHRVMEVRKSATFPDAVVWNPWVDKARGMADFGDEEYKEMLCIEPAVAGSGPTTLQPGQTWTAGQYLRAHPAATA